MASHLARRIKRRNVHRHRSCECCVKRGANQHAHNRHPALGCCDGRFLTVTVIVGGRDIVSVDDSVGRLVVSVVRAVVVPVTVMTTVVVIVVVVTAIPILVSVASVGHVH